MCGIAGILGEPEGGRIKAMLRVMRHRGPDQTGRFDDATGLCALGHNRLSILDLSPAGCQPMVDASGRYRVVFNGEIFNYLELRQELPDYPFKSQSDTEVLLAAYARWGERCLDKLIGIFAFAVWDTQEQTLFAARDRFGVKPFYYAHGPHPQSLIFASEIKAVHAAGIPRVPDPENWALYLTRGTKQEGLNGTFWKDVQELTAGHQLCWRDGKTTIRRWYNLAQQTGDAYDPRPLEAVKEEYRSLLHDSIRLRFRADVPVGICLSGGLDSATLLASVRAVQGTESNVKPFTFVTGDPNYAERPWVEQMLAHTRHPSHYVHLSPAEVPDLFLRCTAIQDEPFGGIPTLAYTKLFQTARENGSIVLLDGQGMDEQWAGYDYYRKASEAGHDSVPVIQGTNGNPFHPECLCPDFARLSPTVEYPHPYPDKLRNLQYRDMMYSKFPRVLRFNDRASMMASTELREPFMDHRMIELAMRQPPERKIHDGQGKWFLRQLAKELLPSAIQEAPKRPLQTPQREWLRGPLQEWARSLINDACTACPGWLRRNTVETTLDQFYAGKFDNSHFVWQWLSLGAMLTNGGL